MKKNIVIDLVNNKTTADSLMLYDAVRLEVITGIKGLFSVRDDKIPKLIIAWHRFPLLEEPNNWMISEDGSSATLEFVLKSFGIKDSFVHIPAKGFRLFEFNIIIPKNNVAVASVRINVQNNTLEGIPFSQQDRDKLDSIDLTNYYTKVEVDNKFASFNPGTGGAVYTFTKPLNVDTNNVVSIDLTEYAKLTDLPKIPNNLSSFTNDTGFITKSALNGYATETFVTSQGYAKVSEIPTIPTNISSFTNDAGYITIKDVPSVDLTPYALKSELFSKKFTDLTGRPTTLAGYGITDATISGRTITLGSNSITVPESSGGSGDYTLTKEAVDGVIGASSTGSITKFYNEKGAFTTVTGFLPLGGGTIDGDLWLNGTLYTDQSLFVTFRNTLTLGCYATGGLPIEPDTVSELVLDKPNATARAKLVYTTESDTKREAGLYLDAKSSSSDPSEIYVPGFIRIWTGSDKTDPMNRIGLNGAFGISIQSKSGVNISSDTNIFKFNSKNVAVVDDITAHNEDTTAHADLLALKVDAETYNTDITAINTALEGKVDTDTYNTAITTIKTALDGKENTGVAQGLVDTHNESATAHEALFEAKADKTELKNYLPLSGGTMTGSLLTTNENSFMFENTTGKIGILFNSSWTNGASIWLHGKDHAQAGCFDINAHDGTASCQLKGKSDGWLLWCENYVTALPGGYSGGTIYVGANRDIKTIADAIAYINRYSSGSNKKWTLKLDAGEYAIGVSVYGLWLSIEPASGSYSTACRLTGQISADHHAVLEFINMHFGGTANGTVNAGIYGKTSLIKCTNCTFYAGTSLSTSIQGDYGAIFYLSGCKFYSPTTSFTGSWFQSIRLGGSCFAAIAGTVTFTGGGYSNSYAMVVFAGSYINVGGAVTISNYKYGVQASQSGNAYVGSAITFSNVTTQYNPAKGAVGNGNSYIN